MKTKKADLLSKNEGVLKTPAPEPPAQNKLHTRIGSFLDGLLVGQLGLLFKLCGTPTPSNWPNAECLPWAKSFIARKPFPRRVLEVFRRFPQSARSLADKFLTLDPSKRISARDALDLDYFWEEPLPCEPKDSQSMNRLTNIRPGNDARTARETRKLSAVKPWWGHNLK